MSRARTVLYRSARLLGAVEAAEKGAVAFEKRLVRRSVYRSTNRATRRLLRALRL